MTRKRDAEALIEALGRAVRRGRQKAGLSQEDLGFEAELDRTYISGVERGVRNPTVRSLAKICKALGMRQSTLLRQAEDEAGV